MNRFQHTGVDPSVTSIKREQVLTKKVGYPREDRGGKPTGHDKYMGKRLHARRRSWDSMTSPAQAATVRPGSMNRRKG